MKKQILLLATVLVLATPLAAQRVMVDNFDQLKVHFGTPVVNVNEGDYLTLSAEDYILGGEVGAPALPVLNQMIVVPFCSGMEVQVEKAVYDTIALPEGRVMPLQPSRSKSDNSEPRIILDEQVYATDAYYGRPLATVTPLGIGRDRSYAVLSWSPVSVNPVTGMMVVCRSASVTVRYEGSDASATMKHYERYHTPLFSMGPTLNTLMPDAKGVRTTAPVRMVIMAPQSLQCTALEDFVAWKRKQGMMVTLNYVANGSAAATVANQLQQMYDQATDAAPAPTYILLVGDHEQLPAFNTNLSSSSASTMQNTGGADLDHITDHNFATWTSDDLPDCYQGRLSATDTTTLRNIITKTLYYEKYSFLDDNYLSKAVLVAGVDNRGNNDYWDNAWRCADPTMDYVASLYVNADGGFTTVYYYKNDASSAPAGVTVSGSSQANGTAATLRSLYNQGAGWINYSAHGDWDEWSIPAFTVSNVNSMNNTSRPSIMIGNCCLSNKFDMGVCLGEALLRRQNKAGAAAYIGATNVTYWTEDFYWSVGMRSNITHTMNLSYNATRKGMYDQLFHTHNEALSDQAYTMGQVLMAGLMSVNRAVGSSTWANAVAEYYWEVYELMGDPSLMPWLGTAEDLTVSAVKENGNLYVTAVPGAYVALVDATSLDVLSSAFAADNGVAVMPVPSGDLSGMLFSVTAQGYKPYFKNYNAQLVSVESVGEGRVTVSPNPASDRCEVSAEGLQRVTLLNMVGQQLQTVSTHGDRCSVSLSAVPAGLYLLRIEAASGTSVRKLVVR